MPCYQPRVNNEESSYDLMRCEVRVKNSERLIKQLEAMKIELEEELEGSEEAREALKHDMELANQKIIELEENLFESKTI